MTIKYQNYKHYKLPITINPLEYGKLIYKTDNIYIIFLTVRSIAVITQYEDFNEVKLYKLGDLAFTYKDHKLNESTFVRSLDSRKFTFKNNELILIDSQKSIILVLVLKPSISINSTTILINLYKPWKI